MPSRKTALNCSERANFAPKETVTPLSQSPLFDLPAIGQLPSTPSRRHSMPCGSPVVVFRQQRLSASGQKNSRQTAAQEVNREAANRVDRPLRSRGLDEANPSARLLRSG